MLDSVRKFFKALRREAKLQQRPCVEKASAITNAMLNWLGPENQRFLARVKAQRAMGILVPAGISASGKDTVKNLENRWVRRAINKDPSRLYNPAKIEAQKKVYPSESKPNF